MEEQNKPQDKTFFLKENLSNISSIKSEERVQEINTLIDFIRKHSPISIWDLAKQTKHSHSKLYYILRDLEFAGVVHSKIQLNKNNRSVRMVYIKK